MKWRERSVISSVGTPQTPQSTSLKPYVEAFALSRQPFDDLVDGVEMDLRRSRYETFDELVGYCQRVASAVGVMCIEVFGCRDSRSREYAFNLGLALQLTNIIRDIKGDLEQGRVYLPQEDLARFGVSERALASGVMTDALRKLLAHECQRARQFYTAAAQAMPHAESRKLVAAEIMGASTSKSCSASSGATTTCSPSAFACRNCSGRASRCRSGRSRSCPRSVSRDRRGRRRNVRQVF